MINVVVCLATYNGEKYIKEQIDSILSQHDVKVTLVIRDDCSSDNTSLILKNYKDTKDVYIIHDDLGKIGVARNFMQLLKYAYENFDADFFAFSDQDDIWLKKKLSRAVSKLEENDASLYGSGKLLIDEKGKFIKEEKIKAKICLSGIIQSNKLYGCTMVLRRDIVSFVIENNVFSDKTYHDVIFYLIAILGGYKVYIDNKSFIKYRLHSSQVTYKKAYYKLKGFFNILCHLFLQIAEFICPRKHYRLGVLKEIFYYIENKIPEGNQKFLCSVINYNKKISCKMVLLSQILKDKPVHMVNSLIRVVFNLV